MLKAFVYTTLKLLGSVPGLLLGLYALLQMAEHTGFDTLKPAAFEKLRSTINYLLGGLIENVVGYIILCGGAGFYWSLVVAEPKSLAKRNFEQKRRQKIKRDQR